MDPFSSINDIATLSRKEFEDTCRANTKCAYLGDDIALCIILSNYKVYVDTRDTGITPHLIMDGFWESWLTQSLARIVRKGDVCIDIGANFGYYSVLMSALCGENGKTIAIEPNPRLCQLLRSTASINPFIVEELAASNSDKKAVLNIPETSFGDASILLRSDRPVTKWRKIKVKTRKLDTLLNELNISHVDVIKIDVEGFEVQVFEGMKQTIQNNPGLKIIIEYSPFLYANPKEFSDYLKNNFIIHRIKDVDTMKLLNEAEADELLNLKDHTDLLLERKL